MNSYIFDFIFNTKLDRKKTLFRNKFYSKNELLQNQDNDNPCLNTLIYGCIIILINFRLYIR